MKMSITANEFRLATNQIMGRLTRALKDAARADARADRLDETSSELRDQLHEKGHDLSQMKYERDRRKEDYDYQVKQTANWQERANKAESEIRDLRTRVSSLLAENDKLTAPQEGVKNNVISLVAALAHSDTPTNRLLALKLLRQLTGLSLLEAKKLVNGVTPVESLPYRKIPLPEEALS